MFLRVSDDLEGQFFKVPPVKPLRPVETWKAAITWINAFDGDPLNEYIRADSRPNRKVTTTIYCFALLFWMRTMIVLAINAGAALIVAKPVKTGSPSPRDRLVNLITQLVAAAMYKFATAEQKKRREEVDRKISNLTSEILGTRTKEMIYVGLLATEPQSQGHGYGSALVETISSYGDSLGQAVWLHTDTHKNVLFYNSFGFKVLGETLLGDDNPEWHQDPVNIRLMVREPRAPTSAHEKPHFQQYLELECLSIH